MKALRAFRPALAIIPALVLIGCRSGPTEGWSSRVRTMILTSDHTEIALSSSRVPGYWARQADSEQEFFLYTRDRSHEKGHRVNVEGPFGIASPAVFRDESGIYLQGHPLYILVVWKMEKEVRNRAPRS